MMAATHRIGGVAAGIAVAVMLQSQPIESAVVISGAVLGSLIPDIDNRHSSISRKWRLVSAMVTVGQAVIRGFTALLPAKQRDYVRSLIGHRGITHSLLPVILLVLSMTLTGRITGITLWYHMSWGMAFGILSHLILDMFAGGVPLFLPFSTKRVLVARIRTGGLMEWLFRLLLVTMMLLVLGWIWG